MIVSAVRSRTSTASYGPRSPSSTHVSFRTRLSCDWIHSTRGVGNRPERQKILSSSTTGRPVISPNCRARVDFPAAPRPSMTTRFIRDHFDRLHLDLREPPRARSHEQGAYCQQDTDVQCDTEM